MKTSPASIRDSWAYQKWGAKGARTYLNLTFAALGVQAMLLLAGFVYFTFVEPLMPQSLFTLACCFFLLAALKLIGMHRRSLLQVSEAESSQGGKTPANV
jgi:hypothetical protein